jgi:hypothetical protein
MSVEIKMMDLSFCSDGVHNVVNSEAKEFIMNRLKTKYEVDISKKHAFILNTKSIYFLEKTQHIMSIKSSGTNYYLYFTNINNINYCFYIDRKIKSGYTYPRIISVKYCFNDTVFQDTLLDGELVRDINDNDSWVFLITDILIHKGIKLDCNIVNRYNVLYEMLTNDYNKNHDIDICPLIVKKLFLYKDYDELITQFIPSLPYKTNGLYFNSLNTKHANQLYLFKNNNDTNKSKQHYKSKESGHNNANNANGQGNGHYNGHNGSNANGHNGHNGSNANGHNGSNDSTKIDNIILKIKQTGKSDIYELYCNNRDEEHKLGVACIPNLRTSKLIRNIFEKTEDKNNVFVNCKLNDKFGKYEPISLSESNSMNDIKSLK